MKGKTEIQYIPVDKLKYDPQNPRLPSSVVKGHNEKEVINWMLTDASIIELMGSIGEKGFFPAEPLLVVADKKDTGKYIVIEGNRRLTAVKLLLRPELANKRTTSINQIIDEAKLKPSELPVIVFSKREDILDYLGFKHITGVKPWSALAKAKYLKELQKDYKKLPLNEQYKKLAQAIGSRADYVEELLLMLDLYERVHDNDYFGIDDLNEDSIDFGTYYNAIKYSNIASFVGIDKDSSKPTSKINIKRLEELVRWVSEKDQNNKTKLGESRNLSKLNSVVSQPKALALFRDGRSLDDSLIYTEEPYVLFKNSIIDSLNSLKIGQNNLHFVRDVKPTDKENLEELVSIAEDTLQLVERRLSKSLKKSKK
jgi:hypothetical protein